MAFSKHVWDQLKATTADELIAALGRDGFAKDPAGKGATIAFIKPANPNKRVVIHYHPRKTYGPGLLKGLIADIGWDEKDLRRVKLIK
jgi:predicted RNA binding protein YcfA (HicA-like mRNA interferase family)